MQNTPKPFDVTLRTAIGTAIAFTIRSESPRDFHNFLAEARKESGEWATVDAVNTLTGRSYVVGFSPAMVLQADVAPHEGPLAEEAEQGCDGNCADCPTAMLFPQTERGKPDPHEALERLFRGSKAPPHPLAILGLLAGLAPRRG